MAEAITLAVGGGTMRLSNNPVERLGGRFLGALRRCAGGHHQCDGKSGQRALMQCGHSASERAAALARTLRTLLRFIDSQRTAVHLMAIQSLDCRLRFVL